MPRFLSLATVAAVATTLMLMLGGGQVEALASGLDPLAEVVAEEQHEMIDAHEQQEEEHRGPQLEGSATDRTEIGDIDIDDLRQAAEELEIVHKIVEHPRLGTLVRAIGLPELLRRIRATAWQREAIAQILERASLEMRLLREVRNHEGTSWYELDREIRQGRLDPETLAAARERLAKFHATRIAGSDETFEQAAQAIQRDAIERVSDLLDTAQDQQWRSADKRWALRALSFVPTVSMRSCWIGRRVDQKQLQECIG